MLANHPVSKRHSSGCSTGLSARLARTAVTASSFLLVLLLSTGLTTFSPQSVAAGKSHKATVPNAVPPEGTYSGEDVKQPIEFPHYIHADVNKINCMYCHTYARRSKVAGIPPTSKCMGCHSVIATDKPRIKKLTEYWEKHEPPPWKKVHDVPDFVHFTHEKHLRRFVFKNKGMDVANVSEVCAFCHGEVKKMTVAKKNKPLNMGFCRQCHENNSGPHDCWKCHK